MVNRESNYKIKRGDVMKVSEAKTKICPFIQEASVLNTENNYPEGVNANINCECGDCMAWVWEIETTIEPSNVFSCPKDSITAKYNEEKRLEWSALSTTKGHCKRLNND